MVDKNKQQQQQQDSEDMPEVSMPEIDTNGIYIQGIVKQNQIMMQEIANLKKNNRSAEAMIKLVNQMYDTPTQNLPELTELGRNVVLPLTIIAMKEHLLDPKRNKKTDPISKCWREDYYRHQRSVGRRHFMAATGVAKEQVTQDGEKRTPMTSFEL